MGKTAGSANFRDNKRMPSLKKHNAKRIETVGRSQLLTSLDYLQNLRHCYQPTLISRWDNQCLYLWNRWGFKYAKHSRDARSARLDLQFPGNMYLKCNKQGFSLSEFYCAIHWMIPGLMTTDRTEQSAMVFFSSIYLKRQRLNIHNSAIKAWQWRWGEG